jgi:hypothetical protein
MPVGEKAGYTKNPFKIDCAKGAKNHPFHPRRNSYGKGLDTV